MRESDLLPPLVAHFESRGLRTVPEVAVAGRRADLVAVSEDALVAVEMKLAAWREAFRQALAYQVWAPVSYVALPFPCALRAARSRDRFEAEGIGLLAVLDGEVRTFVPAMESPRLFPALTEHVRGRLLRREAPLEAFSSENVFMGQPCCAGAGNASARGTRSA